MYTDDPIQIGATRFGTYLVFGTSLYVASNSSKFELAGKCDRVTDNWCHVLLPREIKRIFRCIFSLHNVVVVDQDMVYWGMGQNDKQQLCGVKDNETKTVKIYQSPLYQHSISEGNFALFYDGVSLRYRGQVPFSAEISGIPKNVDTILDIY